MIPRILDKLDTPTERARLARAIIDLRDAKRLDALLAAAAIIDLDSRSRILLNACLVHAAFIHTGRLRTPGGLCLAAWLTHPALVPSVMRGWVSIAFVAVFVALMVISLVRLYRRDRRATRFNRGDCLHCGYSLTGNVSGVCPECGSPVAG